MAYDTNLTLQALVTKTATFNGAAVDIKTGTPRRGMKAKVWYTAAMNSSGSNNVVFNIDHSDDNSNWYTLAYQIETPAGGGTMGLALSTTSQQGELNIPFETNKRYVRLTLTVAGGGSGSTITYSSQIGVARP